MGEATEKPARPAAAYAGIYPLLCEAVRPLGYALALHGSMGRDLDLLAVPWTEEAAEPDAVVEAIRAAVDGWTKADPMPGKSRAHGRRCWLIWFRSASGESLAHASTGHPYIDLSIMPRMEVDRG